MLLHLEPMVIEKHLTMINEERSRNGLPRLVYVIPFRYLTRASLSKGVDDGGDRRRQQRAQKAINDHNTLRNYLHDFVFIKATRSELDMLLYQDWNRDVRLHLHYCRTRSGNPIRMTDDKMQPLITLFVQQRRRYSFRPITDEELAMTETVHIRRGIFKDYQASVQRITPPRRPGDPPMLTLGIPVFMNEFTLELYECPVTDVDLPGGQTDPIDKMLEPYFIKGIESSLFEILRRRVLHRDSDYSRRKDQDSLQSYAIFNYLKFEDPVDQRHFRALMLLCTTLRRDKDARDSKSSQVAAVRSQLPVLDHPANDEQAFYLAILFIATRQGPYRKTLKDYCQSRDTLSPTLTALMPLIKAIPSR